MARKEKFPVSNQYSEMCYKLSDRTKTSSNLREIQRHLRAEVGSLETPRLNTKTRLSSPPLRGTNSTAAPSLVFVCTEGLFRHSVSREGRRVALNYRSLTL